MKRSKIWLVGILVLALMATLLAGCGGNQAPAANTGEGGEKQVIEMKWAHHLPATHIYSTELASYFIQEVEKRTNGQVKITLYPGEQLGKPEDYLKMLQSGALEIAVIDTGTLAAEMPLCGMMQLPNAYPNSIVGTKILYDLATEGILNDEFMKQGVRPFVTVAVPQYLILNNERPILKPEDLKGLKIRTTGKSRILAIQGLGAIPVNMPSSDVTEALNRGTIDGTANSANATTQYGYHEITKYVTAGIPIGGMDAEWAISEKAWQKLPEDVQKIFMEVGKETSERVAALLDEQDAINIRDVITPKVEQVDYVEGDAYKVWEDALKVVEEQWVQDNNAKGLPASQAIEEKNNLLAKYNK